MEISSKSASALVPPAPPASTLTRTEVDNAVATNKGVGATKPSTAQSFARHHNRLPVELTNEILQLVDLFTLWVTCRRVSRAWRAEAERLYRVFHLSKLKIDWRFEAYEYHPHPNTNPDLLKAWCKIDLRTTGFIGVSKDTSQARFKLGPVGKASESRNYLRGPTEKLLAFINTNRWIDSDGRVSDYMSDFFKYSDLGYRRRYEDTNREKTYPFISIMVRQHIVFGTCMTDITLPWISVHSDPGEISIDWKQLFNELFQEEAWVRRRYKERSTPCYPPSTPREEEEGYIESRLRDKKVITWSDVDRVARDSSSYRNTRGIFYEEAYKRRIKMAHARVGQTIDLEAMHNVVQDKLAVFRQHRVESIIKGWARRRGIKKAVSGQEETSEWSDCEI